MDSAAYTNRRFQPSSFNLGLQNVQARGEARFGTYNIYLAKLHGSLSWTERDGTVTEIPLKTVRRQIEKFMGDSEPTDSNWPGFMVFPSASKFVHTTGFIYGEIIRRFAEFISRPNACLIINGYSLADDHINRLIVSALQNPTLQIIIYSSKIDPDKFDKTSPTDSPISISSEQLRHLLHVQLPQVTIKGPDEDAHFRALVNDLPAPALVDETSERMRLIKKLLRQMEGQVPDDEEVANMEMKPDRDDAIEDKKGGPS